MARPELSILRGAILGFIAAGLLGAGMVGGSAWFRDEMASDAKREHQRFLEASRRYLAVDDQRRIIRDDYPRFLALEASGRIGRERRLDWIESLRSAGDQIGLPRLNYSIEAQRVAETEFAIDTGAFTLLASRMKLDIGLLHEGDLLRLFERLAVDAHGLFNVRQCGVVRSEATQSTGSTQPNLRADCELEWWTLALPGAGAAARN